MQCSLVPSHPVRLASLALVTLVTAAPGGISHASARARADDAPHIASNENRVAAGTLVNGVLTVQLELRRGRWLPNADTGRSEEMQAFAEAGGALQIPSPLIRVPAGTVILATVRNTLADSTLVLHGLRTHAGDASSASDSPDSLIVAPGTERAVRFLAGDPGTYFYWGTTTHSSLDDRHAADSQLSGAFIVDSAGAPMVPNDRVFVIGTWGMPADSSGPPPIVDRDVMVINGRSWPYTERFDFAVGDTVRWRWVNPTRDAHPMHLHGFYFAVETKGTLAADTSYVPADQRRAVTELMFSGETMRIRWVAEREGNWLFHCHFGYHVSPYLSFDAVADPPDLEAPDAMPHTIDGMRGLILGLRVHARGAQAVAAPAARPSLFEPARRIRVVAEAAPRRYGSGSGLAFVDRSAGRLARGPVPWLSSPLILRKGEPVRITVVNRLRAPTAVHWHGMEVADSYVDGVPGWSGMGERLAPAIAPRDSFVAEFTPPRAGTFIYHSHSDEGYQISSGLYGALIVLDSGARYDPALDRTFIVGGNGPNAVRGRVNAQLAPAREELVAGRRYRFRMININPDWRVTISLLVKDSVSQWRPLAKDGADLPARWTRTGDARVFMGPGETADFEVTPTRAGALRLLVATQLDGWKVEVPIRVRAAP